MDITSRRLVEVNHIACHHVANLLRDRDIPREQEESRLPGLIGRSVGNFFFALVAICHQTSPVGRAPLEGIVNGIHRRGWDYLFRRFEEAVRNNPSFLEPGSWKSLKAHQIRDLFRDSQYGDRLTNPDGRAALLRDLGSRMLKEGWRYADDIYEICKGRIAIEHPNLIAVLREFRAYSDPVQKKSLFFLALMRNTHTWRYQDEQNLKPPVDYHEVRGHLRMGTVLIKNDKLDEKLRARRSVDADEDIAIRQAVRDAISLISSLSGIHDPMTLHYLFWNVFRAVCTRHAPQCLKIHRNSALPSRYLPLTMHGEGDSRCPFSLMCSSAYTEDRYLEHVFETDYY